jgi:Homing endonuclease associated repeat
LNTIRNLRGQMGYSMKNTYKDLYKGTVEEVQNRLIKILQDSPIKTYTYFNSSSSGTPAATTYRKYFGSWGAALDAAGISNSCSMKANLPTRVYLVEFDGFYKIGITQQKINERLHGAYPKFEVLLELEMTLVEAKVLEAKWLKEVKTLQYIPTNFPAEGRGFTECFKY